MACSSKGYTESWWAKRKPVALIFLSTECPVSRNYIGRINQLQAEFPQVQFMGVFSPSESPEAVREFSLSRQIKFPTLIDRNNTLLRRYNVTHTPEVFFLDSRQQLLYQGAIDNWYYNLDQLDMAPSEHFLKDAVVNFLQHKQISLKETRPVGCLIEQ